MIWFEGKILPDNGLAINATDRTFEHGLGLFETLRTWNGRATLLDRHIGRMLRSARELNLTIDPSSLPDDAAVRALLDAEAAGEDRMLRITASGGTASGKSVVWMRSSPLPTAMKTGGAIVCVNAWALRIFSSLLPREWPRVRGAPGVELWDAPRPDPLPEGEEGEYIGPIHPPDHFTSRHKTLNYWSRRVAFEQVRDLGYDEILFLTDDWGFTEASRSNLFLVVGHELITISTEAPIVPGIMRRLVLDVAAAVPLKSREVRTLDVHQLVSASEVFLTNAVRGIIPVARLEAAGETIAWQAPGPRTVDLQELIARRLWPDRGGAESP